ncbi:MAG: ComEA family DNA-binding protein [Myxococcota bacterium]
MRLPSDRTVALLTISFCLTAVGVLSRWPTAGSKPSVCPLPARVGLSQLVCNGQGQPAGPLVLLAGQRLNINSATAADLAQMPHISKTLAQRIVQHRQQHGPFGNLQQLQTVKGVGRATIKKLSAFVTVRPHQLSNP